MKRQIKFRGKRADTGEWIFGYYLEFSLCDGEGRCSYIKVDGCQPIKVDPDTVGQFTGLLDKNGKEIYEGDIARFTSSYEKQGYHTIVTNSYIGVIALNKYFQTCIMVGGKEYHIDNCTLHGEVIGSAHDNPELLKGGKECKY